MSQNTPHAIMAQRVEAHDSLDFFPTPPWATRALCEWIVREVGPVDQMRVWEPACGECDMARPLAEYFGFMEATDVQDYSAGRGKEQTRLCNFLLDWDRPPRHKTARPDWIITNPPFRLGEQFAMQAIKETRLGVAMIARTAFLESVGRYGGLFKPFPPSDILQFTERVPMHKGRLVESGSTATAYCWIVWRKDWAISTRFHWIEPCRKRLERSGDYPVREGAE